MLYKFYAQHRDLFEIRQPWAAVSRPPSANRLTAGATANLLLNISIRKPIMRLFQFKIFRVLQLLFLNAIKGVRTNFNNLEIFLIKSYLGFALRPRISALIFILAFDQPPIYRKPRLRVPPLSPLPGAPPVSVLVFPLRVVFMVLQKQILSKRYPVLYLSTPLKLIPIILALLRKLVMVLEVLEYDYIQAKEKL